MYVKACERCQKGKRDCVVDELGAACVGCKARKYGCDQTGDRRAKMMRVVRPVSDSDSEVETVETGKRRRAESPPAAKKKGKVKVKATVKVKEEKVRVKEEKKGKPRPRPKPKAKAPPKSTAVVESEDEDAMVVDEESDEGQPTLKRVRKEKGKFSFLTFSFINLL